MFAGSSRKRRQLGPLANTLLARAGRWLGIQTTGGLGRRLGREPKAMQRHANRRPAAKALLALGGVMSLAALKKRACNSLKFRVLAACEGPAGGPLSTTSWTIRRGRNHACSEEPRHEVALPRTAEARLRWQTAAHAGTRRDGSAASASHALARGADTTRRRPANGRAGHRRLRSLGKCWRQRKASAGPVPIRGRCYGTGEWCAPCRSQRA
jgi:hypothetical protein